MNRIPICDDELPLYGLLGKIVKAIGVLGATVNSLLAAKTCGMSSSYGITLDITLAAAHRLGLDGRRTSRSDRIGGNLDRHHLHGRGLSHCAVHHAPGHGHAARRGFDQFHCGYVRSG